MHVPNQILGSSHQEDTLFVGGLNAVLCKLNGSKGAPECLPLFAHLSRLLDHY